MSNAIVIDKTEAGQQTSLQQLDEIRWQRLANDLDPVLLETIATEIALGEAIGVAADLLDGKFRGRVVVDANRQAGADAIRRVTSFSPSPEPSS